MSVQELDRVKAFLEKLNRRVIEQNNDRVILVVGDEGYGKSTFMLECVWLWQRIRDENPSPESVLDNVVWGERDELRENLLESERASMIAVQDAAHALMKKEAMNPDQVDLEKSFLDIRVENYVILLGYQAWSDVPTYLQSRRAENAFHIPFRGHVRGFCRSSMDDRIQDDSWPDPDLKDRFPDLEGTTLWDRFEEIDAEKKRQRLRTDEEDDSGRQPRSVVDEIIRENAVGEYIDENEYNGQTFISKPLIRLDYPDLSGQEADQVKHGLRRETSVLDEEASEPDSDEHQGEGETPTT